MMRCDAGDTILMTAVSSAITSQRGVIFLSTVVCYIVFSQWKAGFNPRRDHVGFVLSKVAWWQIALRVRWLYKVSYSIHSPHSSVIQSSDSWPTECCNSTHKESRSKKQYCLLLSEWVRVLVWNFFIVRETGGAWWAILDLNDFNFKIRINISHEVAGNSFFTCVSLRQNCLNL